MFWPFNKANHKDIHDPMDYPVVPKRGIDLLEKKLNEITVEYFEACKTLEAVFKEEQVRTPVGRVPVTNEIEKAARNMCNFMVEQGLVKAERDFCIEANSAVRNGKARIQEKQQERMDKFHSMKNIVAKSMLPNDKYEVWKVGFEQNNHLY